MLDLDFESGGHRIQRIPPTERRGRVHTSTVTVAVIDPAISADAIYAQRDDADFRVEWFSGSGAGGQHRNKHQNSCRLIHIPTGIVETRQGRERTANLRDAKSAIMDALDRHAEGDRARALGADRKHQVGSGQRADKIVTIRFQDDRVSHHSTGKTMSASRYMRGYMDDIWAA